MGDLKVNVSYSKLKQELSGLSHGISKMTDGYLREIADVGKERLEQAYGDEYDASYDYDGIIPVPSVSVQKTTQNSYVVQVSEDAAILEYGTGEWSEEYLGDLPSGWSAHVPDAPNANSGRKDYWYFEVPSGLEDNPAWDWVKYRKQVNRPPRPKRAKGFGDSREFDKQVPFLSLVGAILREPDDSLQQAWDDYEAYRANPQYTYVKSKRFGVAYGHAPANGIPKAWDAMLEKAEESAKKFYLKKYK